MSQSESAARELAEKVELPRREVHKRVPSDPQWILAEQMERGELRRKHRWTE